MRPCGAADAFGLFFRQVKRGPLKLHGAFWGAQAADKAGS
jgi:hypothetical protein